MQSFFEIGCGTGFVLGAVARQFPAVKTFGSEIHLSALEIAQTRAPGAELMQMDARAIPFTDRFDVIGAFDVIEHITEDEQVLAQIYQALKPGGVAFISVPQHPWLWSTVDEESCHVRRYTAEELPRKLRHCGFSVLRSTSFVALLLPALLLSRRKPQPPQLHQPQGACELRLPRWLDVLLSSVMALERVLIQFGLNFPLGGSRLVIARRPG